MQSFFFLAFFSKRSKIYQCFHNITVHFRSKIKGGNTVSSISKEDFPQFHLTVLGKNKIKLHTPLTKKVS